MDEFEMLARYAWLEAESRCPFCELTLPCAHFTASGDEWTREDRASWN